MNTGMSNVRRPRRRAGILLFGASLLAIWLVFFAWPPPRPLAVFQESRTATAGVLADSPGTEELRAPEESRETPTTATTETRSRRAAEEAAVAVELEPSPSSDLVRVHGHVLRRGLPVDDLDLLFQRVGAGVDDWEEWEFTEEDGTYEVFLAPGRYVVLDDEGPWLANLEIAGAIAAERHDIHLPAGVVRGRVLLAPTGEGAANATVVARCLAERGGASDAITQGLMARAGETRARADGSFELVDLRPGEHVFVARMRGVLSAPVHVVVTDAPFEDLVLILGSGHALHGVVRGPENEPLAMELQLFAGTELSSFTQLELAGVHDSGRDGAFVIEGLAAGPYVVVGRGETRTHDFALQEVVDFHPGTEPVELRARRCGQLDLTLLYANGTPVPEAHLDLRAHDGGLVVASVEWLEGGSVSDAEGRILLDDVLPGRYCLRAGPRGRLGPPAAVEVRAEETTRLELVCD